MENAIALVEGNGQVVLSVVGQGHNFLLWYHWDVIGEQTTNRRRTGELP